MITKKEKITNLIYILLLILIFFMIYLLRNFFKSVISKIAFILFPFFIAFILIILVNNTVNILQRIVKYRIISITIVCFIFGVMLYFIVVSIIPTIVNQAKEVVSHLPNILKEIESFIDLISDGNLDLDFIFDYLKSKTSTLEGALSRVVSNTLQYLKQIIFIPVIFVVGVFDYNNIKDKFISKLNNKKLLNMIIEIKNCSYEFMKTYILITILLTIFSSFIFNLIGLPNFCLLGFVVGVTNIIPIIGPLIGGAICTIYAFTINLNLAIIVFVIVFIIQLIESNIITPYLQAKSTKNHTLEVILSLIVFGEIFGVFGMILSSLILSTIKIIYKYYGSQLNMAIRKVK